VRLNPFARPDPERYERGIRRGLEAAFDRAAEDEVELERVRLVVLSDQHRGARDGADDFQRCERAYNAALAYYFASGHRLFLLGDVEELWECRPEEALGSYQDTLALEARFFQEGRLERMFGNHDDLWSHDGPVAKHLRGLLPNLEVREGLRLRLTRAGSTAGVIFLVHGHQGTRDSDRFGVLARLVVRYVWRPLQRRLRIPSTTPALDWDLRGAHNRAMFGWARGHPSKPILVAGHTHQPVFGTSRPEPVRRRPAAEVERDLAEREDAGAPPGELARLRAELEWARAEERRTGGKAPPAVSPPCYFNTGCCSFGDGDVTGLEIADGEIRLVRWPDREGEPAPVTLARDSLADVLEAVNPEAAPYAPVSG
jgi:hypothetical protein